MKLFCKLTSLGIAAFGLSLMPVQAVQLSLAPDGVIIDTGSDKYTLKTPTLSKTAGGTIPGTMKLSDDGKSLIETFTNGTILTISIDSDGKTIEYTCSGPTDGCQGIGVNMSFPTTYANGGKYAFDDTALTDFPAEYGKVDNVAHGDHGMFKLMSLSGVGFSLKMPRSWNKLQDNRFYNNATTFEEQYLYVFSTYPGKTSFTIVVDDLAPPTPAPTSNP